jgi:ABC-type branched-subunit amino acid transport system substrate-binding protein
MTHCWRITRVCPVVLALFALAITQVKAANVFNVSFAVMWDPAPQPIAGVVPLMNALLYGPGYNLGTLTLTDGTVINLVPIYYNTECTAQAASLDSVDAFYNQGCVASVGPQCSAGAIQAGNLAAVLNTPFMPPVVSSAAGDASLSDKTLYPSFLRTIYSGVIETRGLLAYASSMGFREIGMMYSDEAYGQGFDAGMQEYAAAYNITVVSTVIVEPNENTDNATLDAGFDTILATGVKAFFLIGNPPTLVNTLLELAVARGIAGPAGTAKGYAFFVSQDFSEQEITPAIAATAVGAFFTNTILPFTSPTWLDLYNLATDEYGFMSTNTSTVAMFLADSMLTVLYGIRNVLMANETGSALDPIAVLTTGTALFDSMNGTVFLGATGNVSYNVDGDRQASESLLGIYNYQGDTSAVTVGSVDGAGVYAAYAEVPALWPGSTTVVPLPPITERLLANGETLVVAQGYLIALAIVIGLYTSYISLQVMEETQQAVRKKQTQFTGLTLAYSLLLSVGCVYPTMIVLAGSFTLSPPAPIAPIVTILQPTPLSLVYSPQFSVITVVPVLFLLFTAGIAIKLKDKRLRRVLTGTTVVSEISTSGSTQSLYRASVVSSATRTSSSSGEEKNVKGMMRGSVVKDVKLAEQEKDRVAEMSQTQLFVEIMKKALEWEFWACTVLMAGGIIFTRWMCFMSVIPVSAISPNPVYPNIVSALVTTGFTGFSVLWFVHAPASMERTLGSVTFTAAIVLEWTINLSLRTFTYQAGAWGGDNALRSAGETTSDSVYMYIVGIIIAAAIGGSVQLSYLKYTKASRSSMQLLCRKLTSLIETTNTKLRDKTSELKVARGTLGTAVRSAELLTRVCFSTVSRPYAVLFSAYGTTPTAWLGANRSTVFGSDDAISKQESLLESGLVNIKYEETDHMFSLQFRDLIRHPVGQAYLMRFMARFHREETLLFIMDVDVYRETLNPRVRALMAQEMADQYIGNDAFTQINISSVMASSIQAVLYARNGSGDVLKGKDGKQVRSKIDSCPATLFDNAQAEAFKMIEQENSEAFQKSDLYHTASVLIRSTQPSKKSSLEADVNEIYD